MMLKNINLIGGCLIFTILFTACGENSTQNAPAVNTFEDETENYTGEVINSEKQDFGIDTLATDLENPWGMAFLPDNRILVTERPGRIRIIEDGNLLDEPVQGVPEVFSQGQGGLLDIQLHPNYEQNGWIYFSYSKPGEGGSATTLVRAKLEDIALTELEEIFQTTPFISSNVHFGSRIVFDNDGYLFLSTGERGTKPNSQDLSNHHGKILRMRDDGSVPDDNPFVGDNNAKPEIWTYGHRNVQGMTYDRENNRLWAHEHGPKGGDELHIIEKGNNYGWPKVTYGVDYDGSTISDKQELEGIEPPLHYWVPSIAPCGMTLVTSDRYPNWKGNLLIGALAHQHVARVEIEDGKYVGEERLLDQGGRVRAVAQSPDGYIYVAKESPGLLVKLIPVNN